MQPVAHFRLTRHPPLAQVAYALTIGAHALLHVAHKDVPELLLGVEDLFSSCFQAVACLEVQCPVSRALHGLCHVLLIMVPVTALLTC